MGQQDKILCFVTNKGMYGEKTNEHYASGYIPQGLAAKYPNRVWVVDIDDPKNELFLHTPTIEEYAANKGKSVPAVQSEYQSSKCLWAFPVDGDYKVTKFHDYQQKGQFRLSADDFKKIAMILPYTSSEGDPRTLLNMRKPFLDNTLYVNDPEWMDFFNSKESLIRLQKDLESECSGLTLPNVPLKNAEELYQFTQDYPNFVLRVKRSTEGAGVFIHLQKKYETEKVSEVFDSKGQLCENINRFLQEGQLLATPYVDTKKCGDLRVYAYWDFNDNKAVVEPLGVLRHAPKPTKENPLPKCNVSSGGSYEIQPVSADIIAKAKKVMHVLHHKYRINMVGLDFFPKTSEHESILSEINCSADGWNYVGADKKIVANLASAYQQTQSCQQSQSMPTAVSLLSIIGRLFKTTLHQRKKFAIMRDNSMNR